MLKELKTLFAQQAEQELLQTSRDFYSCMQEEGQSVSSYVLKMKGYIDNLERLRHPVTLGLGVSLILIGLRKEYDGFVHNYNMHSMGKTVNELHAMLKLHEQTLTLPKSNAPALHAIRAGKVQKAELMKKKKNATSGAGGSGIFVIELNTILNRSWIYDTGCGTHICNTTQGLRASWKLKPGALSLYMGNGQHEAVEAIGAFYLCLPSGLVILLNNCHYAPSITRGVISVSRLYDDGFVNRFVDNVVYFSAVPRDENQLGKTIKSLRSDRGGEYMSQEFFDHLKDHGIIAHRTPCYTPQHNGVSKRRNRTLLDMVRSMMSQTTLPKSFWDYALETAARILNMVPNKKRDTLTKPDKLKPRSIKCIFVGYPKETMGYSFYYLPENKVLVAQNAEFLENSLINQEANCMCLYIDAEEHELGDIGEPANYKATLLDPESEKWLNVMNVEMQSMKDNEVWVLVELPPNGKTVGSKWLFKKKTDMDGNVHIYKARLVAKGYTQTPGIDYEETFSPVADIRAIRILIAIVAYYDYEFWQMDVKTAFLNGYLNEKVYMEQPEGFVNPKYPNRLCTLIKT
nr:hypothetical protein [Tanacetum cinerariifolium]